MRSSRDRGVHNLHTEQMDAVWQFWAAELISSALVASGARLVLDLDLKVPRPVAKSGDFVNRGRTWGKKTQCSGSMGGWRRNCCHCAHTRFDKVFNGRFCFVIRKKRILKNHNCCGPCLKLG